LARVVVARRPRRHRPDRVLGDLRPGDAPSTPGCLLVRVAEGWARRAPASGVDVSERAWLAMADDEGLTVIEVMDRAG
jgi:hypothetical protein